VVNCGIYISTAGVPAVGLASAFVAALLPAPPALYMHRLTLLPCLLLVLLWCHPWQHMVP
jgi:hypothetical protein